MPMIFMGEVLHLTKKSTVSASIQDYLEAILNLSEQYSTVRITDLARSLQISKASVTGMVSSMVQQKLIEHNKYGPIALTKAGKDEASNVRYRHKVIKDFLTRILGVDNKTAEREACRMEHAISFDTTEKLVHFLEKTVKI